MTKPKEINFLTYALEIVFSLILLLENNFITVLAYCVLVVTE